MGLMDKLKEALGNAIAQADEADELRPSFLSTGIAGIDWAGGGGIAEGRMAEVFGPYSVGKSLLISLLMIQNEKRGGVSLLGNQEESFDADFYATLGGDPSKVTVYPNPAETGKKKEGKTQIQQVYLEDVIDIFQQAMRVKVTSGAVEPLVIGWDGIAASIPKAVDIESPGDHNMKIQLARAFAMSHCSQLLFSLVRQSGTVFVATNQCREGPDPFERETKTTGGKSYPYACTQRVEMDFAATIKNDKGARIGRWVKGTFIKNKAGTPWRSFFVPLYGQFGLHPIYETPLKPGPHLEEALWAFLAGHKVGEAVQYFALPEDGKPYIESCGGGGYYTCHAGLSIPDKFRRADWPKVLADNSKLWEVHKQGEK